LATNFKKLKAVDYSVRYHTLANLTETNFN